MGENKGYVDRILNQCSFTASEREYIIENGWYLQFIKPFNYDTEYIILREQHITYDKANYHILKPVESNNIVYFGSFYPETNVFGSLETKTNTFYYKYGMIIERDSFTWMVYDNKGDVTYYDLHLSDI